MASSNITVMKCDRCGETEELRKEHRHYVWAKIWAAEANGPRWIGSQHQNKGSKDICPTCMIELYSWWNAKKQ